MENRDSRMQEIMMNEPVAVMLLKNYFNVQLPLSKNGNTRHLDEVQEPSQKGLGISLNSLFLYRSVSALARKSSPLDLTHMYKDLSEPSSWLSLPELEHHLRTDYGSFNQGISHKDGFIFGFDQLVIESLVGPVLSDSAQVFYHHKIVGGEPRGEFYSLIYRIFEKDMRETLGQLIDQVSVGSGTTSQITDQCFGAMLAGPNHSAKQYRMRKTKLSSTLDIGHMLIYDACLTDDAAHMLSDSGFDFSLAYNPDIPLMDIAGRLLAASEKARLAKRFAEPSELFDIRCEYIYAENDGSTGVNSIKCDTRINGLHETQDITEDIIKAGIMEVKYNGK
jgi:hypothetical protein